MQQHSLLATKLYVPPIRPELVSRLRLIERLNARPPKQGDSPRKPDAAPRALTLLSAPAGFGKTTLVSEWIRAMAGATPPTSVAWLSLDAGDNDLGRFLAYLIAALRTIGASLAQGVSGSLQSAQPPAEDILTVAINEIAARPGRIVLVLDDYHLIEAQSVHDALIFLLEHLPPHMHLVIATREDPTLPLARLRAAGQLTELRASDLRFTSSETAEFLNRVMGLDLSAKDIAALETRTEGWIAGLQLAALSIQGRQDASSRIETFTGSHRYVLDYLLEEVLEQQPESIQIFLMQTAVLDRLAGPLCDALTGQDNGQAILETLDRANLFIIPLDQERRWYRYHGLFADLLRQRLRQTQSEQVPALYLRASEWYAQSGFVDEAIEHALHAAEFKRAANLIEKHVDALWQRGQHAKLQHWLAGLPADLVDAMPHLCILNAWDMFISGQQETAERSLQAAEKAIGTSAALVTETLQPDRDPLSGPERMKIQGRAAAIRAFLAFHRGDVPAIEQYSRQALEYLPEQDLTWRSAATVALGDAYSFVGEMAAAYRGRLEGLEASRAAGNCYMTLISSMKLAVTLRQQGHLQRVIQMCQQQLQLATNSGLSQAAVVGWLLAIWGEVLAELNDLDRALDQAEKGTELARRGRDVAMSGWSHLCLVRALFSRGDLAGAEEIIQKMKGIAPEYRVPPWITNLKAAWQVRIWLAQDKLETACQWVKDCGLDADGDPTYLHETEYVVLARILTVQGRLDETGRLLQRLLEATESGGRTSRMIEILMLQALASQAQGNPARAMTTLNRALTLAEPGGFIRIFVDEGPPMLHLLQEALAREIAPDYVRRLLAAFPMPEPKPTRPSVSQCQVSDLIEPLSERELEVLQLLAQGLTNPEIASRLFLSLNTVKAHTRNIYGKLDTHSRTQAVARASALGILPFI